MSVGGVFREAESGRGFRVVKEALQGGWRCAGLGGHWGGGWRLGLGCF